MVRWSRLRSLVAVAATLLLFAGCGDSEEITRLGSDDLQNEVNTSSLQAAILAPSATVSADAALELLSVFSMGAAPGFASAVVVPQCPATFELPNGLSGTCAVSEQGVVTIAFQGTVEGPQGAVSLTGSLVATPSANPSSSGSTWAVELEAAASGPFGTRTWDAVGTIALNGTGDVVDYDWTMTTAAGTGGGNVTVRVDPVAVQIVAQGPLGNVVRFDLDRQTSGGTIAVNGEVVAVIVFEGGCVVVDFADARLGRQEICPEV